MRILVSTDEWYPVYDPFVAPKLAEGEMEMGPVIEVDAKDFRRWREAFKAFERAQDEIKVKVGATKR